MAFSAPRINAIGLSSSWLQSQVNPSLISARKFSFSLFFSVSIFFREGIKVAMRAAEIKKEAESI